MSSRRYVAVTLEDAQILIAILDTKGNLNRLSYRLSFSFCLLLVGGALSAIPLHEQIVFLQLVNLYCHQFPFLT
jgi:hypothetical protein